MRTSNCATAFNRWLFRFAWCVVVALTQPGNVSAREGRSPVVVVVSSQAHPVERLAAQELARCLGQIYPREQFVTANRLPESGKCILVGSVATDADVRRQVGTDSLPAPESFIVTNASDGPRQIGVIAGADSRGTACGVYALLEKLGCGFYLSGDTLPPARQERFSFDGWQLADQPLVRDRLVFNWHNFLSGCSTWNLDDWQSWIRQSHKMGFNAVMVHAYGNNPMATFTFNGKAKPVGYLATTVKGRDWATTHVNDVRRLWGGEVFNESVFGADAASVPDNQRTDAAQQLMRGVFAFAEERAMDVYFAYDVDTVSANPQDLIATLPPEARFATDGGKFWLANPETPEGYRYYKAQVEALLQTYPQITCLAAWFRFGGTPWMDVKLSELPQSWRREYETELARTPEAAKYWHAPQIFAIGKIIRAWDRALKELGRDRVQLAAGTWRFHFLTPCDRFFPPHVKLIGLDYDVLVDRPVLRDAESREDLRKAGAHRPVLPVIWAQHDDGRYVGRPYTPFSDFHSKLTDANAAGFGIIHWTTRPLDLFFTSHAKQVWQSTKDQPLRATCGDFAARMFGASARDPLGDYVERWVTDAPQFGRETGGFFIDRPMDNAGQVIAGCRERLKLIDSVKRTRLTREERERLDYFRGLENFSVAFHETHGAFQRSQALLKAGDLAAAKEALAGCQPEKVIEQFAKLSSPGGATRGEQGLVVSLNLRWLVHYTRQRQALGSEPVRYNFGPTSHEPLAQSGGKFTYHFDTRHNIWQTLGTEETGADTFSLPAEAKVTRNRKVTAAEQEICRTGIESERPIKFAVSPIMGKAALPVGDYRLRLLMLDPVSTAAGQRVFDVRIGTNAPCDRVDIFKETARTRQVLERYYPVTVGRAGEVVVTLAPVRGKALICGAVLHPVSPTFETNKGKDKPGGPR